MKKVIVPILVFLLVSCENNDATITDAVDPEDTAILFYTEILNEYALVNEIFQDVVNNSGDALLNAEGDLTGKTNDTKTDPAITVEPFDLETFPKTIKVDFGSGTLCRDGVTRRGVIAIVSTGWYGQQGSVHTTTFNNYYHDVFKVEGTQIVENLGANEDGHQEFSVMVEEGMVTAASGITINFDAVSTRTWIAGSETPLNIWDDEYLLDANQWGSSSNGTPYQLIFEEPLHYVLLPRAIKSGIIDLAIGSVSDIKINYNNRTTTILGVTTSWN